MSNILKSSIPQNVMSAISAYITNIFAASGYNSANSGSGTTSATLNAKSGIIKFTGTIAATTLSSFAITNSYFSTNMKPDFELIYTPSIGHGILKIQSYSISGTTATVYIYNQDGSITDANIYVQFKLQ